MTETTTETTEAVEPTTDPAPEPADTQPTTESPEPAEKPAPKPKPPTDGVQVSGRANEPKPDTDPAKPKAEPTSIDDFPPAARKMIEDLRKENASSRVNAKEAAAKEAAEQVRKELAQSLGKALGLVDDKTEEPKPVDPAELARLVQEKDDKIRDFEVKEAIRDVAGDLSADSKALTDSMSFMRSIKGIDPSDTKKLAAAIKAAVEKNPKLKAAQAAAPAPSGGEFAGGPGESPDAESMSVDDFRAARRKR
ncbi:hypothetical protein [Allonocardiopsis opalescens]|uniref:Scaffolding protein n=1 Tax=Allonocardiopsis opalescens TaxID=1144618 RepID=A0A2T0PSV1_9ACTN|nr:hypothetical protein [Allonocardiopsis opalescens]PRX91977.1 hypothetical protein CLV72_11250 [Allonocardiopsis opalescens]